MSSLHQRDALILIIIGGSALDRLIPMDVEFSVKLEDVVFGGRTLLAVKKTGRLSPFLSDLTFKLTFIRSIFSDSGDANAR